MEKKHNLTATATARTKNKALPATIVFVILDSFRPGIINNLKTETLQQ